MAAKHYKMIDKGYYKTGRIDNLNDEPSKVDSAHTPQQSVSVAN